MYKVIILVLCAVSSQIVAGFLPQDVVSRNCKRTDPNLNKCLQRRASEIMRTYHGGNSELGIDSFDPLFLKEVSFQENDGTVNLQAHLTKITLVGHKSADFREFTFDPRTLSGVVKVYIPQLLMRSNAHVAGSVLGFPVNNEAIYNWRFDKVSYLFTYQLRVLEKKSVKYFQLVNLGVKYFQLVNLGMQSYSEDGALEIESTNAANQLIDQTIQNAFNGNPRMVMDALNSFMTKSAAEIYKTYFNGILGKVPTSELLPR